MSLPNLGFGSKTNHDQLGGTTYPRYMVMYAERKQTSDSIPNDEDPIFGFRGATTHTTGNEAKVYVGILNGVLPSPEHNITVSNLSAGIEITTDRVIAKPGIIFNPQSAAGPAVNGSLYFDSDDGQLWLYSGGWTALTTGAGMTAHDLTGAYHTEDATGGAGNFLKADSATTFSWQAHGLGASDVGAYTTAQVDSAIDTDIATHAAISSAHHVQYTDTMTEAVITAELINGQSIDNAIDALISTHAAIATAHQDAPALIATHASNSNAHHIQNHALIDTTGHTVAGLTIGHFLKAITATTYGFQAHGLGASDVGAYTTAQTDSAIDTDIATHNVADNHIAHSGVTITAGTGLSGGGTIAATRTINCDITQYTNAMALAHIVGQNPLSLTNGLTTGGDLTVNSWNIEIDSADHATFIADAATGFDARYFFRENGLFKGQLQYDSGNAFVSLENATSTESIRLLNAGGTVVSGNLTAANIITAGNVDGIDISAISLSNMPTAATGNIDCGAQAITNVGNVDGVDVSAHAAASDLHVAHSGVSIIAGAGLSGGGTIAANRTISCDITQYTDAMTENVITAELVDGQSIDLAIDALINTHNVANNHIDHSGVSVIAGTGLSGGGTIAATRTINCDITQYTDTLARTAVVDDGIYPTDWDADTTHAPSRNAVRDKIVIIDSDISGKTDQSDVEDIITVELVNGQSIDNAIDALISTHNVADNHIAHSGVTITAGTGLTGGGTIAASRTINCSITQYTDALVEAVIDAEIVGGQSIDNAIDSLINTHNVANRHIDHSTVSITAGTGLSGGGTIAANRTINCDITQYTNAMAVAAVQAANPLALTNAIKIGANSIEDSTGAEMIGFNGAGFIDFLGGQGTPVDNDVLAWDTSGSKWTVQAQIGGGAGGDWFKTITGITNDVVADATDDTLTLATGNNILGIVGTAVTDTITFTINQANISHDSIGGVSADDHHPQAHAHTHASLTTVTYNQHHTERSVPSFTPYLANGTVWNALHAQAVIQMPANDNDCEFRVSLRVPNEWPSGGCTLKIMYSKTMSNVYSGKWTVTALYPGDNWVTEGKNVLNESTAYDFAAGTANIVYLRTIVLSDADIVGACSLGVKFQSDALNAPILYILEIWIEPT